MFDILSDSAMDIAQGLLAQAYGNEAPGGGVDFPSACTLSKCETESRMSDLHVEMGVVENPGTMSEIPWLADVTRTEVQGPADTDSPFVFPTGEAAPPGMFGSALKAYGEVIATCIEFSTDFTAYDKWFRCQWGIDESEDLSQTIPQVRSHGLAFWGGVGRKLAPAPFATISASKQIKVVWHGTNRKKFGDDVLVDWPRLTALAKTVGMGLLTSDRFARNRARRIDFRINKAELPVAPKGIGRGIERIITLDNWDLRETSKAAIEYIQGYYKRKLALIRGGVSAYNSVIIEDDLELPTSSLVKFLKEEKTGNIPDINFADWEEPVYDFIDVKPARHVEIKTDFTPNVYHAFGAVIKPFIAKNYHKVPPANRIRNMIDDLEDAPRDKVNEAESVIKDLLSNVVPDDFLIRVYRLFCVALRNREKAGDVVIELMKSLHAPRSSFQVRGLQSVGKRILNTRKSYKWMLEEVARAASRYKIEVGQELHLTSKLRRILSCEDMTREGLATIVSMRRNWWAFDYLKRATMTDVKKKKVNWQIRSRLFKVSKIHIDIDGIVTNVDDDLELCNVFYRSAMAYLRKHKAFGEANPGILEPVNVTPAKYVVELDRLLPLDVTWNTIWRDYIRAISYLVGDVKRIVDFIVNDFNSAKFPIEGDLIDDLEMNNLEKSVQKEDPGPTNIIYPEEPAEEEVDAGEFTLDDDFDLDDDVGLGFAPFGKDAQTDPKPPILISLFEELHEDLPTYPESWLFSFAAKYDDRVTVQRYNELKDKAIIDFIADLRKKEISKKVDEDVDQGDIRDRK